MDPALQLACLLAAFGFAHAIGARFGQRPVTDRSRSVSIRRCEKASCWAGKDEHLHGTCSTCGGEWTTRDVLGEHVREVWIAWAKEQKDPKPSWLVPWSDLPEPDREVDRRIGEVLFGEGEIQGVAKMACRMADAIEIARREGAAEMLEKAALYVESADIERLNAVLAARIRKLEPQTTNPKPQTTPPRRGGS